MEFMPSQNASAASSGLSSDDPPARAGAIIFDCDGTLADTMPVHYEAWIGVLERLDLRMSEDRFYALGGWPTRKVIELLAREADRSIDLDSIAQEKEGVFERMLDRVTGIGPVVEVVHRYRGVKPIAVATGAVRPILDRILGHIGLTGVFQALVCAEDVPRHKPAPDVFLEAARRLGAPPGECLVYEDTDPGVQAAIAAGMAVVDVRDFHVPRRVTPRE